MRTPGTSVSHWPLAALGRWQAQGPTTKDQAPLLRLRQERVDDPAPLTGLQQLVSRQHELAAVSHRVAQLLLQHALQPRGLVAEPLARRVLARQPQVARLAR